METKICRDCGVEKRISYFSRRKNGEGRFDRCDGCPAPKPEPLSLRERNLRRRGVTPEQYDIILAAQQGGCAICGDPPDARSLAVDHDHSCCPGANSCGGCIRGLLCSRHNLALGLFKDNLEELAAALDYLEEGTNTVDKLLAPHGVR